jgi:hypothetical protein
MTEELQNNQAAQSEINKISDKELNFRALENKYKRLLEEERNARLEAEKRAQEIERMKQMHQDDDEDDDDPYLNKKRFKKETARMSEELKNVTKKEIQNAIQEAIQKEREEAWIRQNSDFMDVMKHADKLVLELPDLAESILKMPDNFERQKLVYNTIKNLSLHKPKDTSIQDKIDANRKGAHYQPSGVGTGGYSIQGDFSMGGQKAAYEKMQQLKSQLRL